MKGNYNETHPELKEGEMFLSNNSFEEYTHIGWKTKRLGIQAYTIDGEELTVLRPVFVRNEEYEEGMKKYHKEEEKDERRKEDRR